MKGITAFNVRKISKSEMHRVVTCYSVDEKRNLMEYIRGLEPCWFTSEPAKDPFTGEQVEEADFGYSDGEYTWYETEIYCLEKYNLALTEEFREYVKRKTETE